MLSISVRRAVAPLCVLALALAGCGGDDDDDAAAPAADDTTTTAEAAADEPAGDTTTTAGDTGSEGSDDAACGPLAETESVTVSASSANLAFATVYLAQELGYFEEQNLDVTIENLSSSDALAPLGQGRLDMTLSTINAGVYNAIESGIDIRWTAPLYEANPEAAEGLYVQAELFPEDQDTFDVSVLAGKVVSTPAGLGGTSTFILAEQLLDAGLTLDDLTYRQMGTTDILAALEQGGLDMGWLSTPFWGQVADNPDLRYVQGFPDAQNGTAMLMGPSMSGRPEVAEAFYRALLGVSEDHLSGDYLGDPEVVAALSSALDTPEEDLIVDAPNVFDAGMRMDGAADFNERMQQTFIDIGGLLDYDEPLAADAVIDESFLDAARACTA